MCSIVLVLTGWQCRRSAGTETAGGGKPNIIFLLADDMRYDALGCTGNPYAITPNLDALAAQGTNFKNSYVTSPICCISRASIFTGQYAKRHGITNFENDLTAAQVQQAYPSLLRQNGYYTGFIGKYGVGKNLPSWSFDYWKGYPGQGVYFYKDSSGKTVHETEMMGEEAQNFLKKRDKSKPFCLSISFKAPHSEDGATEDNGFIPDPFFNSWYTNVQFPFPETYDNKFYNAFPLRWRISAQNVTNEGRVRWNKTFAPAQFQVSSHGIYRLVSGVDKVVGELRDFLQANKLDKNTILVFASDNGFYMGEHGLEGKWYGHEESVRVPLIVYDPRMLQQRKVVEQMVLNIDLAPTILTWAGVTVPDKMQGEALQPLLTGTAANWRQEFFYEHPYQSSAAEYIPKSVGVITPSWKYMRYYNGDNPAKGIVYEELFDVATDPHEKKNRMNEPAQESLVKLYRWKVGQYEKQLR